MPLAVKGTSSMTYFTSRAQDCAEKIKQAQADVERTTWDYRRTGRVDAMNAANRKLADAHDALYTADSGMCEDRR
jgi:hypothetical protein